MQTNLTGLEFQIRDMAARIAELRAIEGYTAEEMAQNIVTLLSDTQKAEHIAQAGFDFTNRVYDWGKATELLENAMNKAL